MKSTLGRLKFQVGKWQGETDAKQCVCVQNHLPSQVSSKAIIRQREEAASGGGRVQGSAFCTCPAASTTGEDVVLDSALISSKILRDFGKILRGLAGTYCCRCCFTLPLHNLGKRCLGRGSGAQAGWPSPFLLKQRNRMCYPWFPDIKMGFFFPGGIGRKQLWKEQCCIATEN